MIPIRQMMTRMRTTVMILIMMIPMKMILSPTMSMKMMTLTAIVISGEETTLAISDKLMAMRYHRVNL